MAYVESDNRENSISSAARDLELMGNREIFKTLALQDHAELRRLRKDPNTTEEEISIQELVVKSHVELAQQANEAKQRFDSAVTRLFDQGA